MASHYRLLFADIIHRSLYCDWKIQTFCDLKAKAGYYEILVHGTHHGVLDGYTLAIVAINTGQGPHDSKCRV